MQIAVVKHLAETYGTTELQAAEEAIVNEQTPAIQIEGKDEGEQLTHVLAALDIHRDIADNKVDLRTAIRNFSQRVRNSIN